MEHEKLIHIINTANKYCYCVNILDKKANERIDEYIQVVFPLITFSSLTCEVYLKALVYKNTGSLPKGHNLRKLYNNIAATEQQELKKKFNEWIGDRGSFDEEIDRLSEIFVQWRYLYEQGWVVPEDHRGVRLGSLVMIMNILHDICNEYKNNVK